MVVAGCYFFCLSFFVLTHFVIIHIVFILFNVYSCAVPCPIDFVSSVLIKKIDIKTLIKIIFCDCMGK